MKSERIKPWEISLSGKTHKVLFLLLLFFLLSQSIFIGFFLMGIGATGFIVLAVVFAIFLFCVNNFGVGR